MGASRWFWIGVAVLGAAFVALIVVSPEESTLGGSVKLVYVHAAIAIVGEGALVGAGVLGLLYLFLNRGYLYVWAGGLERAALALWVVSGGLSALAMQVIWGGINWREPKLSAFLGALALAFLLNAIAWGIGNSKVWALAYVVVAVAAVVWIGSAGLQLHPASAIRSSDSLLTQVAFYGMIVVVGGLALLLARLLRPRY